MYELIYNKQMKKYIIIVLIVVTSLMVGCGQSDPVVKGKVVEVNIDIGEIMVESTSEDMPGLVRISIGKKAEYKNGVSNEFAVGNYVEMTIEDAVAQSYPPLAIAKSVKVTKK